MQWGAICREKKLLKGTIFSLGMINKRNVIIEGANNKIIIFTIKPRKASYNVTGEEIQMQVKWQKY